ncbi:MAG: hypothetical protein HY460_00220 [Parcubacteria group bacterium]|nr:hypothetical protein [Parcubacteria group bacterium]
MQYAVAATFKGIPCYTAERDLTPVVMRRIERNESECLYNRLLTTTFVFSGLGVFLTGWRLLAITERRDIVGPFMHEVAGEVETAGISIMYPSHIREVFTLFHNYVPLVETFLFAASAILLIFLSFRIARKYLVPSMRLIRLRVSP